MVHSYKMQGLNIALDVNSGSVHVLDDVAYEVLQNMDENGNIRSAEDMESLKSVLSGEAVQEALNDLTELREAKLLLSKDEYAEYMEDWSKGTVVKAICLHIAHDCNLRCQYCFAGTGEYKGARSMMSSEVGKKAIDFLVEKSGNRRNLEVDFFGGEPLMNMDTVKAIVDYAKSIEKQSGKNFRFTLTTNAVLLNAENMKYINDTMDNVVLSLDGRPEVNDAMRKRVDGSGSYDRILPKIHEMVKLRGDKSHYVRGTFTRANLDFSKDVLHMADEGFEQISVEPVVANKDSGLDIREEDIERVKEEYETLSVEYVSRRKNGKWFNFFHFMVDLEGGPCVAKRLRGCGSGTEYLAVTPEGDLYPCHQFVGQEEFLIGNVFEGKMNEEVRKPFKDTTVYSKPACNACWAKFFCSGGCAANAWQFNKDLSIPYEIGCELEKKRVECSLWIKAMEASEIVQ